MGSSVTLIFTLVILAGMVFFMTRSQKKQQQKRQDLLSSMKIGDQVVTIGGLHGVLSEVNDSTVLIDCEGIILEFDRSAIRTVTPTASVANNHETPAKDEDKNTSSETHETPEDK
ncbi:preprotein translocase subunit YajC (TC 3.A.5.1.1) [Melissococcus plutonius ATCC 35311]|uniref:Preprotein translocase subunit YajC (TC 3.A.5.1.1) n=1 Tax=Melissococcus plutonius (strain ATCC 35311 / DSM 29964 / CIP 104052 / LMG 20360 / NCIMB 702443) TaxID=940190 RepID=F3Y9I0_MELPT|nr:preprotein translocase subunit YajC [Melissococcus plutonius]BAK21158.1 preprotein translocase subunit YajC (TC 3.A.5.1.1) [Melissococcus plutonius ATCC 35311]